MLTSATTVGLLTSPTAVTTSGGLSPDECLYSLCSLEYPLGFGSSHADLQKLVVDGVTLEYFAAIVTHKRLLAAHLQARQYDGRAINAPFVSTITPNTTTNTTTTQ